MSRLVSVLGTIIQAIMRLSGCLAIPHNFCKEVMLLRKEVRKIHGQGVKPGYRVCMDIKINPNRIIIQPCKKVSPKTN